MRSATLLLLGLSALSLSAHARAGETVAEKCATAFEAGQRLRATRRLVAARRHYIDCAQTGCPDALGRECLRLLDRVQESLPTLVFVARDADGKTIADVRVLVDGALVAASLDGLAVPIDPGPHLVVFEIPHLAKPSAQHITVFEGHKNRRIELQLRGRPKPPPAWLRPSGVVALGLSLAAFGAFAVLGVHGLSRERTLKQCEPSCTQADIAATRKIYVAADGSLVAGVALLPAAVTLLGFSFQKPKPSFGFGPVAGGAVVGIGAPLW